MLHDVANSKIVVSFLSIMFFILSLLQVCIDANVSNRLNKNKNLRI